MKVVIEKLLQSRLTMIDTIKLQTDVFQIMDKNFLEFQPRAESFGYSGEATNVSDKLFLENPLELDNAFREHYPSFPTNRNIKNYKNNGIAYLNTNDGIRVDIKSVPKTARFLIFISFEAPAYYSGSRAYVDGLKRDQMIETLFKVQESLKSYGLIIDVLNCNISRLDIFKNIQTEFSPENYFPVFKYVNYGREKFENRANYADGLFIGSKSREITVYNKYSECDAKGYLETGPELLSNNILRNEIKLKKPPAIFSQFGVDTFQVENLIDRYDNLVEIYAQEMRKIFKYDKFDDVAQDVFEYNKSLFSGAYNLYSTPTKAISAITQTLGINRIIELYGNINNYMKKVVADVITGNDQIARNNRSIAKKALTKNLDIALHLNNLSGKATIQFSELYNELKIKFEDINLIKLVA